MRTVCPFIHALGQKLQRYECGQRCSSQTTMVLSFSLRRRVKYLI